MDARKIIRGTLLRVAALFGILIALTLLINLSWFDEDLRPEVAALLMPAPVSMDGNAYPLIYGFLAADTVDPQAAGLAIVARLRERFADGERVTLSDAEIDDILGHPDLADVWSGAIPSASCNSRFAIDCADRMIDDAVRANVDSPRQRLLLRRYETILQAPRFEENQEFDSDTPLPAYGALIPVARVRLAIAFRSADTASILSAIGDDVRFWKVMLRDGQSLVAKMVALAGLRNDTTFMSALIRRRELTAAQLRAIPQLMAPLNEDERDIGETFLAELRIALLSSNSLAVFVEGPTVITGLALQEHATLNEYYVTVVTPLRLRAALSTDEFYRQKAYADLSYQVRAVPPPLYNLGGKFIIDWTINRVHWQGYISRVHDLEGRIALVLLQAEIAGEPSRRIAEVVRTSMYRNPYTLQPMNYDGAAGTIGFDCVANGDDVCAVAIGNARP